VIWTGIAQKTNLLWVSLVHFVSYESWRDCQRLSVHYLAYLSLFQLILKSLTDRHTVLLLDIVKCVWCQFLTVPNYTDLNLVWGSNCIATNKMCNWRKGRGEERLSSPLPFLQLHIRPRGPTCPTHRSQFPSVHVSVLTLSDLTSFDTWSGSLPFQIFVLTASRIQVDLEWLGGLCQHCVKINWK